MTTQATVQIVGLDKFYARLSQLQGTPLKKTAQKSLIKALKKTVVPEVKAAAPRGHGRKYPPAHAAGNLAKAVDARVLQTRPGEIVAVKVGPGGKRGPNRAWYAHFVIGGTKA